MFRVLDSSLHSKLVSKVFVPAKPSGINIRSHVGSGARRRRREEHPPHALPRAFHGRGYTTETAAGGREALEKSPPCPVDVVVMDVRMPDLDGLTVLSKAREARPGLPGRHHVRPRLARDGPAGLQARRLRLPGKAHHREGQAARGGAERAPPSQPLRRRTPRSAARRAPPRCWGAARPCAGCATSSSAPRRARGACW